MRPLWHDSHRRTGLRRTVFSNRPWDYPTVQTIIGKSLRYDGFLRGESEEKAHVCDTGRIARAAIGQTEAAKLSPTEDLDSALPVRAGVGARELASF